MNKVRQAFGRAASSYDAAARLQRQVCQLLLDKVLPSEVPLSKAVGNRPATALDAGCGTGYGRTLLRRYWPEMEIAATDFAPEMIKLAGGGIAADIHRLPFADNSFDLYWSSLTLQWCDIEMCLREAMRILRPNGCIAISTLATGTLRELNEAFANTDRYRHTLDFREEKEIATACATAKLQNIELSRKSIRLYYPNVPALLRELKALGANEIDGPRRPGLLGRKAWQTIEMRYAQFLEDQGLPASYEVILCTARKPS